MGVFLRPKCFGQKVNVSSGICLNTWKFNVCSIQLKPTVLSLHKIRANKI